MATYLLVHGGWGGGWQWREVALRLRAAGHEALTPTLSGLGEWSSTAGDPAAYPLSRHIDDLARLLWFEDLRGITLVGWSYGATVAEGLADREPERVRRLVLLDAEPAVEGHPVLETDSEDTVAFLSAMADGSWLRAPTEDELAGELADPALRRFVAERERPQPLATMTEPYPETGGARHGLPRTFLRCALNDPDDEPPRITALRADPAWTFVDLPVRHLGLLSDPDVVATALLALA